MVEYKVIHKTLISNIKSLRTRNKFSQKKIGEVLGVSKQAYYALEVGTNTISLKQICLLSNHYNISINSLLFDEL